MKTNGELQHAFVNRIITDATAQYIMMAPIPAGKEAVMAHMSYVVGATAPTQVTFVFLQAGHYHRLVTQTAPVAGRTYQLADNIPLAPNGQAGILVEGGTLTNYYEFSAIWIEYPIGELVL